MELSDTLRRPGPLAERNKAVVASVGGVNTTQTVPLARTESSSPSPPQAWAQAGDRRPHDPKERQAEVKSDCSSENIMPLWWFPGTPQQGPQKKEAEASSQITSGLSVTPSDWFTPRFLSVRFCIFSELSLWKL